MGRKSGLSGDITDIAVSRLHQRRGTDDAGFKHILMQRLAGASFEFGADIVGMKMKLPAEKVVVERPIEMTVNKLDDLLYIKPRFLGSALFGATGHRR